MNENDVLNLFDRYREGKCTPDEIARLESWFLQHSNTSPLPDIAPDFESVGKEIWQNIGIRHPRRRYILILRYAATVLLVVGVSFILFKQTNHKKQIAFDLQPGGNIAVLTLANGKQISLNGANGAVATNPDVLITNDTSTGVVTYKMRTNNNISEVIGMNTIRTPKGGQYQLILPDGSHVFLNAASSLQFPSRFTSSQRKVNLIGEAYFEVVKNTQQPFLVTTEGQQLTVLGTHFNVSAYSGESVITTLAEGSVALLQPSSNLTQLLLPNQQSELLSKGFKIKTVNAVDEIAWKDGMFIFRKTPIAEVLQQLCRWYNVEADFNNLPDTKLNADLSRSATLQDILNVINFTNSSNEGIKIELKDGRRLEISKIK
ncbi:DUF4974 domain-containing protein [Chitinophaga oryziterrae]|uniref:DUF4974 domain-containing protein n=1 Tax=Chitinophaga oryziterrae TaxID=1031224 RepID=A0A6N8J6D4_9BACT|nr:FecR family protein [Chitinophaga oryziterrae]MVT40191.1 DUF4974 domain-containing protein [Chitinophaga oryziterrae]